MCELQSGRKDECAAGPGNTAGAAKAPDLGAEAAGWAALGQQVHAHPPRQQIGSPPRVPGPRSQQSVHTHSKQRDEGALKEENVLFSKPAE